MQTSDKDVNSYRTWYTPATPDHKPTLEERRNSTLRLYLQASERSNVECPARCTDVPELAEPLPQAWAGRIHSRSTVLGKSGPRVCRYQAVAPMRRQDRAMRACPRPRKHQHLQRARGGLHSKVSPIRQTPPRKSCCPSYRMTNEVKVLGQGGDPGDIPIVLALDLLLLGRRLFSTEEHGMPSRRT